MPIAGKFFLGICSILIIIPFIIMMIYTPEQEYYLTKIVAIGAALHADLKVFRAQDLVGSSVTLVPFFAALYIQSKRALWVLLILGVLGYFIYLIGNDWVREVNQRVVIVRVFGTTYQTAQTQIESLIPPIKLLFLWTAISAGAILCGFGDALNAHLTRGRVP